MKQTTDSDLQLPVPPHGASPHDLHIDVSARAMAEHNGPQQEWCIRHILEVGKSRREVEPVCEHMLLVHGSEYLLGGFVVNLRLMR